MDKEEEEEEEGEESRRCWMYLARMSSTDWASKVASSCAAVGRSAGSGWRQALMRAVSEGPAFSSLLVQEGRKGTAKFTLISQDLLSSWTFAKPSGCGGCKKGSPWADS